MENTPTEPVPGNNDSIYQPLNTPPLPPTEPKPSWLARKKKLLLIILVMLLIAVGAAGYFMWRSKQTNNSAEGSVSSYDVTPEPGRFYVRHTKYLPSGERTTYEDHLLLVDPTSKKIISDETTDDDQFYNQKRVVIDGKEAIFRAGSTTSNDGNAGKTFISFIQSGKEARELYSQEWSNGEAVNLYIDRDSDNPEGVYFMEATSEGKFIKYVSREGKVTTLAENPLPVNPEEPAVNNWGITGFDYSYITPDFQSPDGKTLYFHVYSCLECDGPGTADVLSMDLVTKKFSVIYANPSGLHGGWERLDSEHLLVTTFNDQAMSMGAPEYTEALKGKEQLYVFDVKKQESSQIFATNSSFISAQNLGLSYEGDTVYLAFKKLVKRAADDQNSTEWGENVTQEIRAYSIKTGSFEPVNLPGSLKVEEVQSLHSYGDTFISLWSAELPDYQYQYSLSFFEKDDAPADPDTLQTFEPGDFLSFVDFQ